LLVGDTGFEEVTPLLAPPGPVKGYVFVGKVTLPIRGRRYSAGRSSSRWGLSGRQIAEESGE
jgi:hypothetical protein